MVISGVPIANGNVTGTDPLLVSLTDAGGAFVHPLLAGSPASDAGTCLPGVTTVDRCGVTRPEGARCDIGAYERIWKKVHLLLVLRNHP
jgi:hypothetical protein